nr:uncharacterized protein LOC101052725 [Saimiri boliviensis boliviensis]
MKKASNHNVKSRILSVLIFTVTAGSRSPPLAQCQLRSPLPKGQRRPVMESSGRPPVRAPLKVTEYLLCTRKTNPASSRPRGSAPDFEWLLSHGIYRPELPERPLSHGREVTELAACTVL